MSSCSDLLRFIHIKQKLFDSIISFVIIVTFRPEPIWVITLPPFILGTQHRDQQVKDLKKAFSDLDPCIPLLAVSGNHDIGNTPTTDTILEYQQEFGEEYYSFWTGGAFFISINSQYLFDPSSAKEHAEEQKLWLETQLQRFDFSLNMLEICVIY